MCDTSLRESRFVPETEEDLHPTWLLRFQTQFEYEAQDQSRFRSRLPLRGVPAPMDVFGLGSPCRKYRCKEMSVLGPIPSTSRILNSTRFARQFAGFVASLQWDPVETWTSRTLE